MKIDLAKLNFDFTHKPLLVSGMAMKFYGLRDSSKDVDFILQEEDHKELARTLRDEATILSEGHSVGYKDTPLFVDLYGDHGILLYEFELWDSIHGFNYADLSEGAVEEGDYVVISPEKHMFLSTVRGVHKERYLKDALLIAEKFGKDKYKDFKHKKNEYWKTL